jgi:quercetin dioxygenase-like cupin family protein
MRIVSLTAVPRREVDTYGSKGFTVGGLGLTADAHLVVIRLRAGGVVGRHRAAGTQVLLVVDGDAVVTGRDGEPREIGPGQAAVWDSGEEHETRSTGGLTAFVVEGDLSIADG